jgi:hypothetical protein
MKIFFSTLILLPLLAAPFSSAKASSTSASYIVPTPAHLVAHSRFQVEIVKSYEGISSTEISYIFPKELTGDPGLRVDFKRISGDEDSGVSLWEAKEMTATCTDDGKLVQCNVYLKKVPLVREQSLLQLSSLGQDIRSSTPLFDFSKAKDFIGKTGLSQNIINAKLDVLTQFLSSEPAGILSYEY